MHSVRIFGRFLAIMVFVIGAQVAVAASSEPPAAETEKMAERAYLYGLQQAIFYGQRWTYSQNDSSENNGYAGVNRLFWVRKKITPDFPVVTPNASTLYGTGFVDLSNGPVVIEMPEITDRYYSLQVMDQYGIFRLTAGSPFNGTAAKKYLILPNGYDGKVPASFPTTDIVQWSSYTGYAVVRMGVKTGSDEEISVINGYQDDITMTPLVAWLANGNVGVPQADAAIQMGSFTVPDGLPEYAIGQVEKQTGQDFFTLLNVILNDPTMTLMADSIAEQKMLAALASVNIGPGLDFDWNDLTGETQAALETGFKAGFDSVRAALKGALVDMNGWGSVRNSGQFETRWLDRALMADIGWGGPDRNISHTAAFLFLDSEGKPLNGANKYTMTFDLNDLPPVTQFWSIPIYNAEGYFVANEIDRYVINSYMLEAGQLYVEDDKLVIYIQTEKPEDPDQAKNWLPAPTEGIRFTARFYGPYPPLTDGSYKMPKAVRVK